MVTGTPTAVYATCPRCRTRRSFVITGAGTAYRCAGCEWPFTFTSAAPTGTSNAALSAGGTAISVASGGASFTTGMQLLFDTGNPLLAEVLTVTATGSATSIPVLAAAKAHLTAAAFGQLAVNPTLSAIGEDAVPAAAPWGF
jgi:hypothetical protein